MDGTPRGSHHLGGGRCYDRSNRVCLSRAHPISRRWSIGHAGRGRVGVLRRPRCRWSQLESHRTDQARNARARGPAAGASRKLRRNGQASQDLSARCSDRTRTAGRRRRSDTARRCLSQERPVADLYLAEPHQQTFIIRSPVRLIVLVLCAGLVACSGPGARLAASESSSVPSPSAATATATDAPPTATPTQSPARTPAPAATPSWDQLPVAANDPAELASQLAMVESAIRDPNLAGAHLTWMGHLQQLAYSRLQDFPDWKDAVFSALPRETRAAVNASLEAGKQLRLLNGPIPKNLPDWKIVEPKSVDVL